MLDSCQRGDRDSQNRLYREFYGYAMAICLRYAKTKEEAVEIVNDGFIKVFQKLNKYSRGLSFKGWLRRLLVNSAIDHFRRNEKHYHSLDISYAQYEPSQEDVLEHLRAEEILQAVQQLPPSYRITFNLFVIEGFSHEEIAAKLNISSGTSKSNLAIARNKLKKILVSNITDAQSHKKNG